MTSGQKIAFSLLAALMLFAVFVMSLHSALFKTLETRFYAQSKIEENTGQLDKISESLDNYISEILTLVEKGDNAWTKNASVRSYYVQNPSESDVNTRRRLTETLFSEIPALNGIRIVDKNGRNLHYSSFDDTDLLKQSGISKVYKNYNDVTKDTDEIPFETLQKITSETKSVLLCDENRGRLILSVPFCWVDGIYSGDALFYLNLNEIEKELIRREAVSIGQGLTLYSDDDYDGGFVLDLPHGKKSDFRTPVLSYWKTRSEALSRSTDIVQQPEKLLAIPDGRYYLALSSNRIGKIRISAIYTNDVFELSKEIRLLVYICIFISILLIVFLFFSFFRDPVVTLKKRIKKIQLEIIENYLDGKEKREWGDVARHFRQRRDDLSDEIIKSLHVHSKKRRKEISDYLDKNWDEIFAIFETKAETHVNNSNVSGTAELNGASIAEIRRMLEEVLQNRNIVSPVAAAVSVPVSKVEEIDELEEAEEVEEVEEVEELAEDVDEIDEVEEIEEADEVDEVEELSEEAVEDLEEPVEELEEPEEVLEEPVEDLEEPVEDPEEFVEELDEPVEELEEPEEVLEEPVEELEESADDEIETLDEPVDDTDEELDVLEECVEPENSKDEVDDYLKTLVPPKKEYKPSDETFFASEEFASVDNLFAEELKLGDFSPYIVKNSSPVEIKLYPIPEYKEEGKKSEPAAEVEELTEEVPEYLSEPDFSMISFGDNLSQTVPELEGAEAIVEKDGVFSISENLDCKNVVQDQSFKELVDSVLS